MYRSCQDQQLDHLTRGFSERRANGTESAKPPPKDARKASLAWGLFLLVLTALAALAGVVWTVLAS